MVDEVILRCAPLVCASHVLACLIASFYVSGGILKYLKPSVRVRIANNWRGYAYNWVLVVSDTVLGGEHCIRKGCKVCVTYSWLAEVDHMNI